MNSSVRKASIQVPLAAASAVALSLGGNKLMDNISASLTPQQVETVKDATFEMCKQTGLSEKGVKLFFANENNVKMPGEKLPKILRDILMKFNTSAAIARGENAGFAKDVKFIMKDGTAQVHKYVVCLPENKLFLAAFHELGHALNCTKSKIGKTLQNLRLPSIVLAGAIVLFTCLSKESKPKDGKELNKTQKANNLVRNNAGKLAFVAMLPVVAEEAMASIKASKWANANMAKDLSKKVAATNMFGFATYLALPLIFGLSAYSYVRIKNWSAAIKEAQKNTQNKAQIYSMSSFISKTAASSPLKTA